MFIAHDIVYISTKFGILYGVCFTCYGLATLTFDLSTSELVHKLHVTRKFCLSNLGVLDLCVLKFGAGVGQTDGQTRCSLLSPMPQQQTRSTQLEIAVEFSAVHSTLEGEPQKKLHRR